MKVILFDLDATRADHLSCYGYPRETSPEMDRISSEGAVFGNYYCSDAPCLPSRTALMSGLFGIHNGVVGHAGTAAERFSEGSNRAFQSTRDFETLPAVFRKATNGKTALISTFAERHSAYHFYNGFNEIYNLGEFGNEIAEEVTPIALDWLDKNKDEKDWYLHINFWDAHTPRRTPENYPDFEDELLPNFLTKEVFEQQKQTVGPHSLREINMYDEGTYPEFPKHPGELKDWDDLVRYFNGYDSGIKYMDDQIGKIVQKLADQGIEDEVAIIITADHGESIGEFGIYGEHGTADQSTCNIPLIIKWPGIKKKKESNDLIYHIDLLPTLADLLGVEKAKDWDGRSFANLLKGEEYEPRQYLVLSQCAHVCQRSVRFGDWLYIRTYHDGYRLDLKKEMLFNLKNDPYERNDIAKKEDLVVKDAVYLLQEWHDQMMLTSEYTVDPLWTVMHEGGPFHAKGRLQEYLDRLEATGRSDGAAELRKRYSKSKFN